MIPFIGNVHELILFPNELSQGKLDGGGNFNSSQKPCLSLQCGFERAVSRRFYGCAA